ncbi:UNVERIFIED_CONTAM: hypothetical protein Slati_0115300 [Sesamum latifolium]|uniref:Uncharacterized protein n=1 Tax=Sesamum latifolium TaxID=2727402 RepID=A0AAW2YA04_9LAMI
MERCMIPQPPLPSIPLPEMEQHELSVEPFLPEPIPLPRVRRMFFLAREEDESLRLSLERHRLPDRAQRALFGKINSKRNTVAEAQMRRDEQLQEISEQVDRIGKRMEELRRPMDMGPGAPLEMDNIIVWIGLPFIPEILAQILGDNVKIPDLLKYHGETGPKEHLTTFNNISQLYGL